MKSVSRGQVMSPPGARQSPLVSVVIVNFNGGWLLTEVVRSVLEIAIPLEVVIVDNGSQDESLGCLRRFVGRDTRVRFIENGRNLGFAYANNIALKEVIGDYVLLLNPDCIIRPNTLSHLLKTMPHYPEVGMAGCLIRNPDGTEQAGCRRNVPTPWRTLVRVFHLNKIFPHYFRFRSFVLNHQPLPAHPTEVEAISGAFMLVRREALEQVGLLDEHYFLHCEDLDWCMRFRQASWKILFVPDVEAFHYQGMCSKNQLIQVLWYKHKGMVRFYRKFFRHQYPLPLMVLVMGAVWGRFLILTISTLLQKAKINYKKGENVELRGDIYEMLVQARAIDSSQPVKKNQTKI